MQTEFKNIKKILVIKLRHIGDVLLTVPVFRALREFFPNAYIAALVNSGTEQVLTGNSLIDEIIVFNRNIKREGAIKRFVAEISFLRDIRKKIFDMVIALTTGDRSAIISYFSGAKFRLAPDPERDGFIGKKYLYTHLAKTNSNQHMVLQNLDIVKQFGINTSNLNIDFFIPEEDRIFVKRFLEKNNINATSFAEKERSKIIHIHPTSRWLFKCWKDEYMAEIISWLINNDYIVVMTSSSEKYELEKAKRIINLVGKQTNILDLCGKTTIKQLAAISEVSRLFFGVDSAPMHIAAAVGTPVIALFGPTDENQWKPWGSKHIVIKEKLNCMPCKKGNCEGITLRKCMEAIKPYHVKKILKSILKI